MAQLHGAVSREMFDDLWPDVPVDEVPIGSITNGVHAHTWVGDQIDELLASRVGAGVGRRRRRVVGRRRTTSTPRRGLGRAGAIGARRSSSTFVRSRLGDALLDPNALTIGFARRFATYKRATLLLSQPDRLRALLLRRRPARPVRVRRQGPPGRPAGQGA